MEKSWGLHLSAAGHTRIPPGADYPPPHHPAGRAFRWERGRVLPALQLVALRAGGGEIEWAREQERLAPNTAFLLLPGQWHRYRPFRATGWTEDWFELRGELADRWVADLSPRRRLFRLPAETSLFREFDALHEACLETRHASPGYRAGRAMAILAAALEHGEARHGARKATELERDWVARARDRLAAGAGVRTAAAELGLSYPTLHRVFKRATGLAPKAYAQQLRMARAEALLSGDRRTIKEIAGELGFYSSHHFSAAFKQVYGVSPRAWRERLRAKARRGDSAREP